MDEKLITPEDYKYMEKKPYGDDDFDPEHNKQVIEATNKAMDEMDGKRQREYSEKTRERSTAAAKYLKNLTSGKGVSAIDKYFGKRYLAYLIGKEVINKLKANPQIIKKLREKFAKKGKPL